MQRASARRARATSRSSLVRVLTNCEQHNPPTRSDPVREAHRGPVQVEPQLAELAVQLPCVRLAQQRSLLGHQVDGERRRPELRCRQLLQPLAPPAPTRRYPTYSVNAIGLSRPSVAPLLELLIVAQAEATGLGERPDADSVRYPTCPLQLNVDLRGRF